GGLDAAGCWTPKLRSPPRRDRAGEARRCRRLPEVALAPILGEPRLRHRACRAGRRRLASLLHRSRVARPGRLRLELPADLTALVLGAVHVDVEIAGLERRIRRVV